MRRKSKFRRTFLFFIIGIGIYIFAHLTDNMDFFNKIFSFQRHENTYYSKTHLHKESYYQQLWCNKNSGIMEYQNADKTRVDCLTKEYAIEFDFAEKWAEGIGQALYYHILTGKKPMLILILEHPEKQTKYFERAKTIGDKYDINVQFITPDFI